MTFQAEAALPCYQSAAAHTKHAIGMTVGMGTLWKQLRIGQDRAKGIDIVCVYGKVSGFARDVSVTKSECGKRLTACV